VSYVIPEGNSGVKPATKMHAPLNVGTKLAIHQSNPLERWHKDWDLTIQLLEFLLSETFIDNIGSFKLQVNT